MSVRSLGEFLLRPRPFTRLPPTPRFPPACSAQRGIAHASSKLAPPARQESPASATTQEAAAASPQRATRDAALGAVDQLFSAPAPSASSSPDDTPAARVFGLNFSKPLRGRLARQQRLQFEDMVSPDSLDNPSLANKPSGFNLAAQQAATFENYPRLDPSYGRSVELDVTRGRDIVRGIGMLGSLVARNKIRSDFNKQRFHERGG
ncbi:hypothetical protein EJ07DRAFT_164812 [Lizonia empirigonia]|nr:hypothetical protein EJ07DRAFT_164812 [Lizonia empirigonia]